jgi:hypothetical protein
MNPSEIKHLILLIYYYTFSFNLDLLSWSPTTGKIITEIMAAPTRFAAIPGFIDPLLTARSVITITSGS